MNITFAKLAFISILLSQTTQASADVNYKLLSDRRSEIVLPIFSIAEKKLLLSQAKIVMEELFVHREIKLRDFGVDSDAFPRLKLLEQNLEKTNDVEFHSSLISIFNKQRDFHTLYTLPRPYACYRSFIPVSFKEVKDFKGKNIVAISGVAEQQVILDLMPDSFNIQTGDIVISYDGKPISQAMRDLESLSNGANAAAISRQTADMLTYIHHGYELVPEKDVTTLMLVSRAGKKYSITIPWISRVDSNCINPEKKNDGILTNNSGENVVQNEINKIFRKKSDNKSLTDSDGLKTSAEPILKYKKIENQWGSFALLKLESFNPEKLSIDELVLEVKRILIEEFSQTDGLIVDLRNNGGGQIDLSDKLVQLFTPKNPEPTNFVLKSSAANYHYWSSVDPLSPYTKALAISRQQGRAYTSTVPISLPANVGRVGQYYFKPIVLLTNASCYSSCDMFAALMQDHNAAMIIGEDSTTGAGGANVYNINSMVNDYQGRDSGNLRALPYGQGMSFSFRQAIRVGKSAGQTLEDVGVLSDVVLKPRLSDFYDQNTKVNEDISAYLNQSAPNYQSRAFITTDYLQDVQIGELPELFIQWEKTNKMIFRANDKTIGAIRVESDNIAGRSLEIPAILKPTTFKYYSFDLLGRNNGKRVWRKVVNYRATPAHFEPNLKTRFDINLKTNFPEFMAAYNLNSKESDGWTISDGILRIGNQAIYTSDVNSEAAIFLKLTEQMDQFTKFFFTVKVKTEKDFDFFSVKLIVNGIERKILENQSGDISESEYAFDISAYAGQKIEIRFVFTSDGGTQDEGITLSNLYIANDPK